MYLNPSTWLKSRVAIYSGMGRGIWAVGAPWGRILRGQELSGQGEPTLDTYHGYDIFSEWQLSGISNGPGSTFSQPTTVGLDGVRWADRTTVAVKESANTLKASLSRWLGCMTRNITNATFVVTFTSPASNQKSLEVRV